MGTAIKMVEYSATRKFTYASKRAGSVIIVTTLLTVFSDLVIAVAAGTLLSMFLFVLSMGEVYLKQYPISIKGGKKVASYTVEGPLFFGVSNAIASKLEIESEDADIIVLNLMNMPVMDSTGAIAIKSIKQLLEGNGQTLILAGVKEQAGKLLTKLEVISDEDLQISSMRIKDVLSHIEMNMVNA